MGWASGGAIFDRVARGLIAAHATDWTKRQVLGDLIDELRAGDWDTLDESLCEFSDDPVIVGLFREHGYELPEELDPVGKVTRTIMRVHIDFETTFDVTDALTQMARNSGDTFNEVLANAKQDPGWYFDSYLSDLDYEPEVEFVQ